MEMLIILLALLLGAALAIGLSILALQLLFAFVGGTPATVGHGPSPTTGVAAQSAESQYRAS